MWWWLHVVVVAVHVAVVVLLYDCIHAWWLWCIMNEDATNKKGCTLSIKHCAVMLGYRRYKQPIGKLVQVLYNQSRICVFPW